MTTHNIARGYIPKLNGEPDEPVMGRLRIGPAVDETPRLLPSGAEGPFRWAAILVTSSELDLSAENLARLSANGGEHPLAFAGRLVIGDQLFDAAGIHYQSGFYSGDLELSPVEARLS